MFKTARVHMTARLWRKHQNVWCHYSPLHKMCEHRETESRRRRMGGGEEGGGIHRNQRMMQWIILVCREKNTQKYTKESAPNAKELQFWGVLFGRGVVCCCLFMCLPSSTFCWKLFLFGSEWGVNMKYLGTCHSITCSLCFSLQLLPLGMHSHCRASVFKRFVLC